MAAIASVLATAPPTAAAAELVMLAGGDVELGRATGQRLLKDPRLELFETLKPWFQSADVRFVNLESQLSEQKGETISPTNRLVFTGPPSGADALARAGLDVVSTANNHAWDYGKRALLETLDNLDRVGVAHAGTGRDLEAAQAAAIVERKGWKVAFLAVTDIWNQGALSRHEGRHFVASADASWLVPAVASLRQKGADVVVVSYHGGEEYQGVPLPRARALHQALIEAGADVVLGHHPHVLQGVGWHRGRPIFYSLGNLLMYMHSDHPWTGVSMMVRLRFARGEAPRVEVCPYRIVGPTPRPLGPRKDAQWALFSERLRSINAHTGRGSLGEPGADGCAPLAPPG